LVGRSGRRKGGFDPKVLLHPLELESGEYHRCVGSWGWYWEGRCVGVRATNGGVAVGEDGSGKREAIHDPPVDHEGRVFCGSAVVAIDVGGVGSPRSLRRWGAWDVGGGAPASGSSGAGVGSGQGDHGRRGNWSRRKGDEARSLGGGSVHFLSGGSRGGRREVWWFFECLKASEDGESRGDLVVHLYLSSTRRGGFVKLLEELWGVEVIMVDP